VLHLEGVARLEQDRRMVYELPVQYRVYSHHVLVDLRLDFV
jgi:hypothetical protein